MFALATGQAQGPAPTIGPENGGLIFWKKDNLDETEKDSRVLRFCQRNQGAALPAPKNPFCLILRRSAKRTLPSARLF